MATKPVRLTIPTPCQQPWQDMTIDGSGRFCASCQKTVVDFSTLTDQQVINLLAQQNGSGCGRFRAGQLGRVLSVDPPALRSPARIFSLLTAGLLGFQAARADMLPTPPEPTRQHITDLAAHLVLPVMGEETMTDSVRVITGRVVEKTIKEVLPGAFVSIQGTSISTNTNAEGNFQLRIPAEYNDKVITLRIGWIGYKTSEMQIRPDQSTPLVVTLQEDQALLGEVVVIGGYKKLTFFQRLQSRLRGGH
ncbi:carboxypeptidase-like regulatory domain-containing protein [Spirosoma spitsbergense]|uniref:carboxypeptidase-like regulatory domain-containing protein n=1 Tax=Spirosoma spitsbergense TaxID=431554 RepID=UPI000374B373|nr:carboxypeptidase-like regulatory domain-containing protein [Spirosoma spitsbergense]